MLTTNYRLLNWNISTSKIAEDFRTQARDAEIPLAVIVERRGVMDGLRAFKAVKADQSVTARWIARMASADFAELALDELAPSPEVERLRALLDVARRFAQGNATEDERVSAEREALRIACSMTRLAQGDAAWAVCGVLNNDRPSYQLAFEVASRAARSIALSRQSAQPLAESLKNVSLAEAGLISDRHYSDALREMRRILLVYVS
jgi:hypothetical protein